MRFGCASYTRSTLNSPNRNIVTNNLEHIELDNMLVLGAGELGMAVLRQLILHRTDTTDSLTVLVSPASLDTPGPEQARNYDALRAAQVHLLPFDLAACSDDDLLALFSRFHTVINCTGFVAGHGTQTRLTNAALRAGVARYFPWQFGVDYDIVGKGSGQPIDRDVHQFPVSASFRTGRYGRRDRARLGQLGHQSNRHDTGGHRPPDG
jgi:hypothetical protein